MAFQWDALPSDLQRCILHALAFSLVGHSWKRCTTRKAKRERHLGIACLNRQFAKTMKPVLAVYSAPWEPCHDGNAFIEALLCYVFAPPPGARITIADNYPFLYTAVYLGCTAKPAFNRAAEYYTLLGHALTRLLRARVIEWKGLDAVRIEMRFMHIVCKYLDRFVVARNGLPSVTKRLEAAYLAGDPSNPEEPAYVNPPFVAIPIVWGS